MVGYVGRRIVYGGWRVGEEVEEKFSAEIFRGFTVITVSEDREGVRWYIEDCSVGSESPR